jgi:hypothetical protein
MGWRTRSVLILGWELNDDEQETLDEYEEDDSSDAEDEKKTLPHGLHVVRTYAYGTVSGVYLAIYHEENAEVELSDLRDLEKNMSSEILEFITEVMKLSPDPMLYSVASVS